MHGPEHMKTRSLRGSSARITRGVRLKARHRVERNDSAYLFSSPANAERLRAALRDSLAGKGKPFTVAQLRAEFGLEEA
jgi:hypothetical protein